MNTDIFKILENNKTELIEFYEKKLANDEMQLASLKTRIEEKKHLLKVLKEGVVIAEPNKNRVTTKENGMYSKGWTLPQKVAWAFGVNKKAMTARKILETILEEEPELAKDNTGFNNYATQIAAHLNDKSKDNSRKVYTKIKNEQNKVIVGLKEWFDGDVLKEEYK